MTAATLRNWEKALEGRERLLEEHERALEALEAKTVRLQADLLLREQALELKERQLEERAALKAPSDQAACTRVFKTQLFIERTPLTWILNSDTPTYLSLRPPFFHAVCCGGSSSSAYLVDPNIDAPGFFGKKVIAHAKRPHDFSIPLFEGCHWVWVSYLPVIEGRKNDEIGRSLTGALPILRKGDSILNLIWSLQLLALQGNGGAYDHNN